MTRDYNPNGLEALLAAVAKQWLKDARGKPEELQRLCDWLGITVQEAQRRLTDTGIVRIVPTWTGATCIQCGRPVQRGKRGKQGQYCSKACKSRYLRRHKEKLSMEIETFEADVQKARADYEAQSQKVQSDRLLSQEGKQKRLADLEAQFRAKTSTAMERAKELLAAERQKEEAALRHAQTLAAQQQRDLLGPQVVAEFLRADVASMDGPDIVRAVEAAPDDWTRQVLLQSGMVELRRRARAVGDPPEAAYYRLEKLAADPAVAKVQERLQRLKAYEARVSQWNPDREDDLKRRFGIR